jgi:hypothetical protein
MKVPSSVADILRSFPATSKLTTAMKVLFTVQDIYRGVYIYLYILHRWLECNINVLPWGWGEGGI